MGRLPREAIELLVCKLREKIKMAGPHILFNILVISEHLGEKCRVSCSKAWGCSKQYLLLSQVGATVDMKSLFSPSLAL